MKNIIYIGLVYVVMNVDIVEWNFFVVMIIVLCDNMFIFLDVIELKFVEEKRK